MQYVVWAACQEACSEELYAHFTGLPTKKVTFGGEKQEEIW